MTPPLHYAALDELDELDTAPRRSGRPRPPYGHHHGANETGGLVGVDF